MAIGPGPNAGKAPLGVLTGHDITFDWSGDVSPRPESDVIIYEVHVKGFTKNLNSGVHPSRAGTYSGLVEKIPYLKELGITVVGGKTRSAAYRCSQTRPPTAELPHGYVAWALTTQLLRSSGYSNTDAAIRTGGLVRRLPFTHALDRDIS